MSLRGWMTLALTDGLGPVLSGRLIERLGNVDAAAQVSQTTLRTIEGIGTTKALKIHDGLVRAREASGHEMDRAAAAGLTVLCPDDDAYPALLAATPAPPMILYVRGTLEPRDLNGVAIVGSRKCSMYGREQAERFGSNLAGIGVTVVSGGARGVDSHAHKGALVPKNGRTIAVLGCGVDQVYPPENRDLFDRIAASGAVISEFPMGTPPLADNFPRRNRIVSGLSRGVLVIEADIKSGALITARNAVEEHNRPVFALPGRIDNPMSAGPHRLIRDGAVLVETLSDILDNLGPIPESAREATPVPSLFEGDFAAEPRAAGSAEVTGMSDRQRAIVDAIGDEALDVDAISERTSLLASVVLQELTMLSLRGAIERQAGQRFARKRRR